MAGKCYLVMQRLFYSTFPCYHCVKGGVELAVVNCAGYPDVCIAYNVSTYPTVLYRFVVCVDKQTARNLVVLIYQMRF